MNTTTDTADHLIGEERLKQARQERDALKNDAISRACKAGYGFAMTDLESATVNMRAFTRGMIAIDGLPLYLKQARDALDMAERAIDVAKNAVVFK